MDDTDGMRQRKAETAEAEKPAADRFVHQLDSLAYLTWKRKAHIEANKQKKKAIQEVTEQWTLKETLAGILLFVFFGTSIVYTYLSVIVKDIGTTHAALGALASRKVALDRPASPPRPLQRESDRKESEYLKKIREENYLIDSQKTKQSQILLNFKNLPACPMRNPDEKHDFNLTTSHVCRSRRPPYGGERLLTLFTTKFDFVVEQMVHTYENLLKMWPRLGARVRPVLFVADPEEELEMIKEACDLGWDVVIAPACDDDGAPYLLDMLIAAKQLERSVYYGYAHRSTLFDMSIIRSLQFLEEHMDSFPQNLIVGARTNLRLLKFQPSITSIAELMTQTKARGTLGWLLEVDYFFTTRDGFRPPAYLVIGTKHLNNFLVFTALSRRIPVIDISNTTTATHQMPWTAPRKVIYAEESLPEDFDPSNGMVWCAPLKVKTVAGRMELRKRIKYGLCGPSQWSSLPINHPNVPTDRDAEFMNGGSIMFPREDEQFT